MLNKQLSVAGNLEIHEKVNTYKYIYLDTHMSEFSSAFSRFLEVLHSPCDSVNG